MITFGKWNDIVQEPPVDKRHHYARLIQQFARGLAFANTARTAKARACLDTVESLLKEADISVVLTPFNAPLSGGTIAKYLLKGTIAEKENKDAEAIQNFKMAVATEDLMIYNEPRDWLIPARHFLGNILLKTRRYKEAEKVFRENLKAEPDNFIALNGIDKAAFRR